MLKTFRTRLFADGSTIDEARRLASTSFVSGFTTNPTLLRKAGVHDYEDFARRFLDVIGGRPVSFEVVSDTLPAMHAEALEIASWGENVYVKIPITTTDGGSTAPLVRELSSLGGVRVNVTALFTLAQVETAAGALSHGGPAFVSVLAGRIADTGRDPVPIMEEAVRVLRQRAPNAELIWASPREVLNIAQASEIGCHVVTLTTDLLSKLHFLGKDLDEFSIETVRMFHEDARRSGLRVETPAAAANRRPSSRS